MKILEIDYDYYCYPQDISCITEFVSYINEHYNEFIEMTRFDTDQCAFPYFIKEDTSQVYINVRSIQKIEETDATVLCRSDYNARLEQVVKSKCIDCVNYEEDENNNFVGHSDKITLDGYCWGYEKK